MNRQDLVYIVKKTHSIFNGITNKGLSLIAANPPGRTDTMTFVALPIEDPEADLILKHEWSHVLFKTNLHALEHFAQAFARDMKGRYTLPEEEVHKAVYAVCNALDDLRCNSLWAIPYPGSARLITDRWKELASKHPASHLIVRIIAVGIGLVTPKTSFERLAATASAYVHRRGYAAVLVACKQLLEQYLVSIAPEPVAPTVAAPASKSETLVSRNSEGRVNLERLNYKRDASLFIDVDTRPMGPDPDPVETSQMMLPILDGRATPDELEAMVEDGTREVQTVANMLADTRLTFDETETLVGDASTIQFRDLPAHQVRRVDLSYDDLTVVELLHATFNKVLGKRIHRVTDEGAVLVPERYIDMLNGSGDTQIFRDDALTKGFSALVLLDMSGSMVQRWPVVSRACQVLADALSYPFVRLDVWAFSGWMDGTTTIYRFEDPKAGISPRIQLEKAWGSTPIHEVLPVAFRRLERRVGHRHLFLVSDGMPQVIGAPMTSHTALHNAVALARNIAARKNIQMSTMLIGNSTPPGLADAMYGHRRWGRVEDNHASLFDEFVDLVGRSFTTYLNKRS